MHKITLRAARVNAGMNQDDVSKLISVSVPTLKKWENGESFPPLDKFRQLCQLYNWPEKLVKFGEE